MINRLVNNYSLVIILTLLILGLIGYILNSASVLLIWLFVLLSITCIYFLFAKKQAEYSIFLTTFFVLYSFYGFYEKVLWPLWLVILVFVIVVGLLTYILLLLSIYEFQNQLFYSIFINFISLELFLALIPWPIGILNKSVIILALIYFFWDLLNLNLQNKLNFKNSTYQILLVIMVIIAIVATASWVGY